MAINGAVVDFFRLRAIQIDVAESTKLVDILDSLAFLDFFLYLEQTFGGSVSLDDVAGCETVGALSLLLESRQSAIRL